VLLDFSPSRVPGCNVGASFAEHVHPSTPVVYKPSPRAQSAFLLLIFKITSKTTQLLFCSKDQHAQMEFLQFMCFAQKETSRLHVFLLSFSGSFSKIAEATPHVSQKSIASYAWLCFASQKPNMMSECWSGPQIHSYRSHVLLFCF